MKSSEIMQFFGYAHLPEKLRAISKPYGDLALTTYALLPDNEEKYNSLRKLLEAKDCAVRSYLYKDPIDEEPIKEDAPVTPVITPEVIADETDKIADL